MKREKMIIVGCGGHAKVIVDIVEKQRYYDIVGFIDEYESPGLDVYGYKVIGDISSLGRWTDEVVGGIVAVGDNWVRAKLVAKIKAACPTFRFITVIHPTAIVAKGVQIGAGTAIMAAAVLNSDTVVGNHCVVNTRASIDHDCQLQDFVSICPSVTLGGQVTVGAYSSVSLGANVIHLCNIGAHTVIGAGATVLSDIASNVIAYGTPARMKRQREQGELYL